MGRRLHTITPCVCGNHAFHPMKHGAVHLFDITDVDVAAAWRWGASGPADWSASRRDNNARVKIYFHRVVASPPAGMVVDHINGNKADNRRRNLRVCTHQQNTWNRKQRKDSRTRFKGVISDGPYWGYSICVDGVETRKFGFPTDVDAAIAYNEHALSAFGSFARLNAVFRDGRSATRSAHDHPDLRRTA